MPGKLALRLAGAFMAVASIALVACGGDEAGADGGGGSDATVSVIDVLFRPDEVTVSVGDTVTWEWTGGRLPHQVVGTFDGTEVSSQEITGTGTFEYTFTTAGEHEYVCGVHGIRMAGKVIVE